MAALIRRVRERESSTVARWPRFAARLTQGNFDGVSASEIISEIQRLSPADQAEVIRFAYQLDAARMLTGKELGNLAQRMIDSVDPIEKLRLREDLTRGFYGESANA